MDKNHEEGMPALQKNFSVADVIPDTKSESAHNGSRNGKSLSFMDKIAEK